MGFWDDFRNGREQVRAAAAGRAPRVDGKDRRKDRDAWNDAAAAEVPGSAELQAALEQRERELEEALRILAEMKQFIEMQEDRVVELIGTVEPMAKVLRLPGVKTWLLQRFHPDAHPNVSAEERDAFTEAMKAINVAYEIVAKESQSAD